MSSGVSLRKQWRVPAVGVPAEAEGCLERDRETSEKERKRERERDREREREREREMRGVCLLEPWRSSGRGSAGYAKSSREGKARHRLVFWRCTIGDMYARIVPYVTHAHSSPAFGPLIFRSPVQE